jgi:hypothetical protein
MGFDQNSNRPLINFHKWTTKVNLWLVVGMLFFLVAGAFAIVFWHRRISAANPPSTVIPAGKSSSGPSRKHS